MNRRVNNRNRMNVSAQNFYINLIRRGIRDMDMVIMSTIFITMVLMSLVVRDLNYLDVFILNLLHSIDTFMGVRDWRKSGFSMFLGMIYSVAACDLSLHFAIPCVSCIVISWIVALFKFGHPPFSWMFFPFLLMWCLKFIDESAQSIIVIISMLSTVYTFVKTEKKKSLQDCLLICSLIAMNISFALENYSHFLPVSYWLSFVWMWLKSPVRRP